MKNSRIRKIKLVNVLSAILKKDNMTNKEAVMIIMLRMSIICGIIFFI